MSERQTKAGNQEHSLTLTRSHSFALSLFHSLIHSLSTFWITFVSMSMLKVTLSVSHSLTLSMSHSHSFTLSFTHSPHAEQLFFMSMLKSHSPTLPLSFTLISHAYLDPWDMLNNFCFHVYAQNKVTVCRWKRQCFFWTSSAMDPVTLEFIELVPR